MKIGIISDTHDNLINLEKIVKIFNEDLKIDFLIHCGDVCSPFAINILSKLKCDYVGVFGNNDGEWLGIQKLSKGRFFKPPLLRNISGVKFAIMHEGDLAEYIDEKVDFVLFGHTHNSYLKKKGRQTIINPGTLSGYVSGKSTYAIIDLTDMKSEILEL